MIDQLDLTNDRIDFEQAMQRLEDIVKKMEEGNVSLDNALELFEKGVNLIKLCQKKISSAEQKVALLIQDSQDIFLEPFQDEVAKE